MSAKQRVSLVEYWLGKAYPNLSSDEAFQLASNPPEDETQYREWQEEHGAKQMQAWVEVRAEAAKKEITIEAYPRIIYVEPRDWYPPPSNVPEVIPPEYFERDDIMIGPAIPPVIYDSLGGPFSAPWAHPVVVLKAAAAKSHAVQQCVAWLVSERKSGPPNQAKAAYIDEAKWRFGISEGQFRSIWREVARRVPRKDWGKSGRPKSGKKTGH